MEISPVELSNKGFSDFTRSIERAVSHSVVTVLTDLVSLNSSLNKPRHFVDVPLDCFQAVNS